MKELTDIQLAVLDCTQRCLRADDPKDCAKGYGAELLDSGEWELADIELVIGGALEVVAMLDALAR